MSIWIAKIPGMYLTGYMLAVAETRIKATELITRGYHVQAHKFEDKYDKTFQCKPEKLERLDIKEGYQLIWNGDY